MKTLKITSLLLIFCQISFGQFEDFPVEKPFLESGTYRFKEGNQVFKVDSILEGDTLKLMAHLRTIGEFGGHNEYILLYKIENNLIVEFLFNGSFLDDYNFILPSRFNCNRNTKKICSEKLKKLINNYMISFQSFYDNNDGYSYAPRCFGLKLKNSRNYFVVNSSNWEENFISLRDSIFENSLKIEKYNTWYFYGMQQSQINRIIEYLDKEVKRIEEFCSPMNFSSGETFYEEEIRSMAK